MIRNVAKKESISFELFCRLDEKETQYLYVDQGKYWRQFVNALQICTYDIVNCVMNNLVFLE